MYVWQIPFHVLRGDSGGLVRMTVMMLPAAAMGIVTAPAWARILLVAADGMSAGISAQGGAQFSDFSSKIVTAGTVTGGAAGSLILILAMSVVFLSALILWVVLLLRGALLYVLVAMVPFGCAALVKE